MNRKQRRLAASSKGKGNDLRKAMAQAQVTMEAVTAANLDQLPKVIEDLKGQTQRASLLADALADDYEALQERLEDHHGLLENLYRRVMGAPEEFEKDLLRLEACRKVRKAQAAEEAALGTG